MGGREESQQLFCRRSKLLGKDVFSPPSIFAAFASWYCLFSATEKKWIKLCCKRTRNEIWHLLTGQRDFILLFPKGERSGKLSSSSSTKICAWKKEEKGALTLFAQPLSCFPLPWCNDTKEEERHKRTRPRPAMTLMHVDIAISVLIFNAPSPLSFFFPLLMQLVSDKRRRRCPMPFLAEWKKGTLKQPSATEEAFSLFFRPDFCSG